jgi:hypothetical protein
MTTPREEWIGRARGVRIEGEIARRNITLKRQGKNLVGPCPKCGGDDRFSINPTKGCWNCRKCKTKAFKGDVIGMTMWLDNCKFDVAVEKLTHEPPPKANGKAKAKANGSKRPADAKKVEAETYTYFDENNEIELETRRYHFQKPDGSLVLGKNGKPKKTFSQLRPDPDGEDVWVWGLDAGEYMRRAPGQDWYRVEEAEWQKVPATRERKTIATAVRAIPYHLPELLEAIANERTIYIVEGEAKADKLAEWSVTATCNAGGAGKWTAVHASHLRGADVVILPDNDEPGRQHRDVVGKSLQGIAARVRVLEPPGLEPKEDILDWITAGHTREELDDLVEKAADWQPTAEPQHDNNAGRDEPTAFDPPPYVAPDPATLPRWEWLIGRHYLRGSVGATVGAPGRLKSRTVLTEIVGMACGRDLLGNADLPRSLRAAYLNGEETQGDLDKMVAGICKLYEISPKDYAGRLWVLSTREKPIRLAITERNGAAANNAAVEALRTWCENRKIDALAIDPLISFHSVRENDNADMDLVCKEAFGAIAGKGLAVEIVHHPRKLAPGEVNTTVDDARGASAIISAVRSARTLNFMTTGEATQLGIPEEKRREYVRIENGKANHGPIGTANWIKIEVVTLANEEQVACAISWKPPNPFDGVTTGVGKVVRGMVKRGSYRTNSQSPQWLGWAMAPLLGMKARHDDKPKDKSAVFKLNKILKKWEENSVLAIETQDDEKGTPRKFYVVGSVSFDGPEGLEPDNVTLQ